VKHNDIVIESPESCPSNRIASRVEKFQEPGSQADTRDQLHARYAGANNSVFALDYAIIFHDASSPGTLLW
jgi:hypothetical protein